jgi:hypothetical protein
MKGNQNTTLRGWQDDATQNERQPDALDASGVTAHTGFLEMRIMILGYAVSERGEYAQFPPWWRIT